MNLLQFVHIFCEYCWYWDCKNKLFKQLTLYFPDINKDIVERLNKIHSLSSDTSLIEIISYLIKECNINPNIQNNYGDTPIHIAVKYDKIEIIKY